MKAGRKKDPNPGYKMHKHKNGEYYYAYTSKPFQDEKGKLRYKRTQWGHLDERLRFFPYYKFLVLQDEEKQKFIFPKDWDLSALNESDSSLGDESSIDNYFLKENESNASAIPTFEEAMWAMAEIFAPKKSVSVETEKKEKTKSKQNKKTTSSNSSQHDITSEGHLRKGQIFTYNIGVTWLVEQWARKIGLMEDLLSAFKDNQEKVELLLSYVIYGLIFDYEFENVNLTQIGYKYPTSILLDKQNTRQFFESITFIEIERFFQLWTLRNEGDKYLLDSTGVDLNPTINSFSKAYYVDKHGTFKKMPDFILMYSLKSGAPLCYRGFEGFPIYDCKGLVESISQLDNLDLSHFSSSVLITQRGLVSIRDIAPLIEGNQRFLTEVTPSSEDIKEVINQFSLVNHFPQGMEWDLKQRLFFTQKPLEVELSKDGKTISEELIVNLYYDPIKVAENQKKIYNSFYQMQQRVSDCLLYDGGWVEDERFFSYDNDMLNIVYNKKGYVESFTPDFVKIGAKLDLCGYFAIVSKGVKLDPISTLKIYRFLEEHIEALRTLKEAFTPRKDKTDSVKIKNGKIFTTFISLIITETLQAFLNDEILGYEYPKVEDLIEVVKDIEAQYRDNELVRFLPFTIFQYSISKELGLEIPEGGWD